MSRTELKEHDSELKSNLKQIRLLMWKNFTQQKRNLIGTIIEILVPTLFVIILLPIRRIIKSEQYFNNTVYESFSIDALPSNLLPEFSANSLSNQSFSEGLWTIGYYPTNVDLIKKIMNKVENDLIVTTKGKKIKIIILEKLNWQINLKVLKLKTK